MRVTKRVTPVAESPEMVDDGLKQREEDEQLVSTEVDSLSTEAVVGSPELVNPPSPKLANPSPVDANQLIDPNTGTIDLGFL